VGILKLKFSSGDMHDTGGRSADSSHCNFYKFRFFWRHRAA